MIVEDNSAEVAPLEDNNNPEPSEVTEEVAPEEEDNDEPQEQKSEWEERFASPDEMYRHYKSMETYTTQTNQKIADFERKLEQSASKPQKKNNANWSDRDLEIIDALKEELGVGRIKELEEMLHRSSANTFRRTHSHLDSDQLERITTLSDKLGQTPDEVYKEYFSGLEGSVKKATLKNIERKKRVKGAPAISGSSGADNGVTPEMLKQAFHTDKKQYEQLKRRAANEWNEHLKK